jgi:hypothetical protein
VGFVGKTELISSSHRVSYFVRFTSCPLVIVIVAAVVVIDFVVVVVCCCFYCCSRRRVVVVVFIVVVVVVVHYCHFPPYVFKSFWRFYIRRTTKPQVKIGGSLFSDYIFILRCMLPCKNTRYEYKKFIFKETFSPLLFAQRTYQDPFRSFGLFGSR